LPFWHTCPNAAQSSQQAAAGRQTLPHCFGSLPLQAQMPWALQLPFAQLFAV
jgi:hypothetical protein